MRLREQELALPVLTQAEKDKVLDLMGRMDSPPVGGMLAVGAKKKRRRRKGACSARVRCMESVLGARTLIRWLSWLT